MNKLGMVAVLVLLSATGSAATSGVISETHGFEFPLSPNSLSLAFSQFDDHDGMCILHRVTLDLVATESARVTGENDSSISGNVTVNLSGFVTGTGAGLSTTCLMSSSAGPVFLAESDGVFGSGPDYHDFGTISDSNSDSDSLASGLEAFIGSELIYIDIFGTGGFVLSGVTDSTLTVSDFRAFGYATITYEYECIPEPAALFLLGAGAMGLIVRSRGRA